MNAMTERAHRAEDRVIRLEAEVADLRGQIEPTYREGFADGLGCIDMGGDPAGPPQDSGWNNSDARARLAASPLVTELRALLAVAAQKNEDFLSACERAAQREKDR